MHQILTLFNIGKGNRSPIRMFPSVDHADANPVITLVGAAQPIETNADGVFRMDEVEQLGGGNWLPGFKLLHREINRMIKLFIA
jgi:hypothetical protein